METKPASQVWQKRQSVTRPGKFFYTADLSPIRRFTVCRSSLSGRWLVRDGERELPATWASAGEAKRHAEVCGEFGRFAPNAR
jgi:hypothetical protein